MRNFRDIIIEKLRVSNRKIYDDADAQVIWDKIIEHIFFKKKPRLLLDLVFDALPKVNDDADIHDDYKGTLLYIEVGNHNDENYMRITLQQHAGNFTFRLTRVKSFLEMFNIEILDKILEYLDNN